MALLTCLGKMEDELRDSKIDHYCFGESFCAVDFREMGQEVERT